MSRPNKRKQEEEDEALSNALRSFENDFGGIVPPPSSKAFIRGDVVENNQTISAASGKLYVPEPKVSLKLGLSSLPASASNFEEAKKLAAEKARRMLIEAHKGAGPAPMVVAPTTAKPVAKPAKPGTGKMQKSKTTNLDAFKEELKRVQEERDKRKGIREHLRNELGVDDAAIDRIAPALDKPYLGSGEFDDDPYTTNLYVCNLPQDVAMEDLLETFGSFGPLASAKILYPRSEEEKKREHLCGFVAYMCRIDADRALAALQHGLEIGGDPVKMSFARPVIIPPQPFYMPPALNELALPDPQTGLPFNAKPIETELDAYKEKYGDLPPIGKLLPEDTPADQVEAYRQMIKNATVRVVVPPDSNVLELIHRTIAFVVREGPIFEAILMGREAKNPTYQFLYEYHTPAHIYYRWKLFSVLNGDRLDIWRTPKFRMFTGGSWWEPPIATEDLQRQMPKCLHYTACNLMEPERWFPTMTLMREEKEYREEDFGRSVKEIKKRMAAAAHKGAKKVTLNKEEYTELDEILRQLTPEKDKVGDAMLWCAEHATCAQEVVETIYESLCIDSTPLHKKIARLYLIADILANCAQRGVKDMFFYRQYFEQFLNKIFAALGDTLGKLEARIKAEQFKNRVMECFRVWEETALYPREFLIQNQNIFLGLVKRERSKSPSSESEADIDGAPIEDDIDGVPLEQNIFDVPEDEAPYGEPPAKKKAAFKAASWDEVAPAKPMSKWEEDETTSKWEKEPPKENGKNSKAEKERAVAPAAGSSSESDGEIDDKDSPSAIRKNPLYEEERRKLLRDVEVKVMAYQDDLEMDKEPDIKKKVEAFRVAEMAAMEKKLEDKLKKEKKKDKKREKKEKKKGKRRERDEERESRKDRERARSRDRSREREKSRERERSRERRDRERSRSRSRDRDRRDRSRDRDRDRRRERSAERDRRRR